jgi:hypothetical protein
MTPQWSEYQRTQVGKIYDTLARLLPVEGRDYTITFTFAESGAPHIVMHGITPFGKLWTDHCMTTMRATLGTKDRAKAVEPASPGEVDRPTIVFAPPPMIPSAGPLPHMVL